MHDTADNVALIGRAILQAQRTGLSSPSPLRAGAVSGSSFDSNSLIDYFTYGGFRWLVFSHDHASVVAKASLATGSLHGPLKLVAFSQDYFLFSGCFCSLGLPRGFAGLP